MNRHSHDRYSRLAIVASQEKKPLQQPRWWGPERTSFFKSSDAQPAAGESICHDRMTVMPKLSRNWAVSMLGDLWNFARGYFVGGPVQQRQAAVLSFRRHAFRLHGVHQALAGETYRQEGQWKRPLEK